MLSNKNKIHVIFLIAASVLAAALLIYLYIPTCYDGKKNGSETGIDCGGECPLCIDSFREGLPLKCYNGEIDEDNGETGIDCGGNCPRCPEIDCKTAKIEIIPKNPECGVETILRSNLPSNCNLIWYFSTGDTIKGPEVKHTFSSDTTSTYTVILYADTIKIDEENFEVKCQPDTVEVAMDVIVKPTCYDGVQNGDETGIDCGGSCNACPPKTNCSDIVTKISYQGKLECGKTITFICDLPIDCNPIWEFENGKKESGHQVTKVFPNSGKYDVKVYADGVRVGIKEVEITCAPSQSPVPIPPNCSLEKDDLKASGNQCNEDIAFTCNISSPNCNVYWVFDDGKRRYGCEVKYQFPSEGKHHFTVYSGGKPLKASIDIKCPKNAISEENMSFKNDLQAIVKEINKNEKLLPRIWHFNNVIKNKYNFCSVENTRVYVDSKAPTIKKYIMDLKRTSVIENVTLERDTNGCINRIIIQDKN